MPALLELLNPALDSAAIRVQLQTTGLVQIANFLPAASAERLYHCLDQELAWDLAYSDHGHGRQIKAAELAGMSPQQVRAAVAPAFAQDEGDFRFVYNTFRPIDSWQSGEFQQHPLYTLANGMHSPAYLAHVKALTGCQAITRLDMLAARYLPGHFLTPHDDSHDGEKREVAWILNLTRNWQPEWGGLLHLQDEHQQEVTHTFVPRFNSMVLFRPPRWHFVSQVANFAKLPRYTLTGWMLSS